MSEKRTCGDCTLCCKVLGVKELQKERGTWCKFVSHNPAGCRIYTERPTGCRNFTCAWIDGWFDEDETPARAKVVFAFGPTHHVLSDPRTLKDVTVVYCHEAWPGASLSNLAQKLVQKALVRGFGVVVNGPTRTTRVYFPSGAIADVPSGDPRGTLKR